MFMLAGIKFDHRLLVGNGLDLVARGDAHHDTLERVLGQGEPIRHRAAGRAGRLPKVGPEQLAQVEIVLAKGAEANGYPTDLWTLQRVAEVIERVTGVAYHPARVWYILRQGLHWSWQRPARRATERDDEAIARWVKQQWPRLKKGPGARTR